MTGQATDAAILALEERRRRPMLEADVDALGALLADDLVYVHSGGQTDSKASYIDHLRQGHLRYLQIGIEPVSVRRLGPVALVHGRMSAQMEVLGQAREVRTLFLTVWACDAEGVWRLGSHQGTPAPA